MSLIDDILRAAVTNKASDVHINVGAPPLFRINTVVKPSDFPIVTPEGAQRLLKEILPEDGLTRIYADVYVERPSQKAIVIGARGARLKDVGTRARREIEELLGSRVYLDLHVRVAKDWQRDPKQLRKLGF